MGYLHLIGPEVEDQHGFQNLSIVLEHQDRDG